MTDWRVDIEDSVHDFLVVAELACDPISRSEIDVEYLAAPHSPPARIPVGTMAVYGFWHEGTWLKIGKAGPNSQNRYTYQHYNLESAPSTFADSLRGDPSMVATVGSDRLSINTWIRTSTCRVNILLPAHRQRELLSLLEAFLHLRLRPRYEG
jgi:hypothetical protein